jgi:membrane-associated phospholipid phosphatase
MHVSGQPGLGTGISAFPSMHLALFTMNAMFLREFKPSWVPWAWAYTAILLVSSVYLGWHYAVDGIASIALAAGIYFAVRKVMRMKLSWRRGQAQPAPGPDGIAA